MICLDKPVYFLFYARMFPTDADPGDMDAVLYGAGYPTSPKELLTPERAGKGPMARKILEKHPDGREDAMLKPGALRHTPGEGAYGVLVTGEKLPEAPKAVALYLTGIPKNFDAAACAAQIRTAPASLRENCVLDVIGDGVRLYEVQQSSDTTFRLYDWRRVGKDGKPRELHVAQALKAIDYSLPVPEPCRELHTKFFHFYQEDVETEKFFACPKDRFLSLYGEQTGNILLTSEEKALVPAGHYLMTYFGL